MLRHQLKLRPGFSLIELMVAMAMIGVGLIGVASLAAQNVRVQYFNRNSLISAQLAQEGLELARNRRDNDWKAEDRISSTSSLAGLYDQYFIIDYEGKYDSSYSSIDATPPLQTNNLGFYSYDGNTTTPFRRLLTSDCQDDYCLINCSVAWQGLGQSGTYQAESYLYAWH